MWNGFEYKDFEFEGRKATVVFPKKADAKKNWTLSGSFTGKPSGILITAMWRIPKVRIIQSFPCPALTNLRN